MEFAEAAAVMPLLADPDFVAENRAIFESLKSARMVEREHHGIFIWDAECVALFTDLKYKAKEETTRLPLS